MVISYWKVPIPYKIIFNMIRGGNLLLEIPDFRLIFKMIRRGNILLETPDSRQTNFQYDQRESKCWWHQWFNTLVRKRPFYVLFVFDVCDTILCVTRECVTSILFHIGNTDIFRAIIAYCNSVIFFLIQCLNHSCSSHLVWKRQLFFGIFYQM